MENINIEKILNEISSKKISDLDYPELEDLTIGLTKNFVMFTMCLKEGNVSPDDFCENALNCIRHLKIICSKGSSLQNLIASTNGLIESIKIILNSDCDTNTKLKSFQLLANLSVQNERVQKKLWLENELLISKFNSNDPDYINVSAMIIYNMILNSYEIVDKQQTFTDSLKQYDNFLKENSSNIPDFLHILLEYFICEYNEIVTSYENSDNDLKKTLLFFIHDHIENESNPIINKGLLQNLILEFKKQSDCVLKTINSYVDQIDPEFVIILLDIISATTGHENYLSFLKDDRSLFLNIGCLLQAIHTAGKKSENRFTPIQKLDALVPTSNVSSDFEKEISYSFKTKLIKSLANLSFRNKRNQELAREMEIMTCIFECTNADARNPLIKEWSILAIRNLCEDNSENQDIVKGLTKVGNADNPVLSEFKIDDGIFRIIK